MKYVVLFAIALCFPLGAAQADTFQDVPVTTAPTQKTISDTSARTALSPTQVAEMRAQILMARKDYAEAALAYQHLLETDPHNARILNQVGIAYQQLGQEGLAERFYKRAISADKNASQSVNNLGTLEYAKGRYGRAIKDYRRAIAGGGDLAPVYSNLGYAYCAIKSYRQALQAFGMALSIDPNIFDSKGNAGAVMQQRTATDQAELYFLVAKSYAKAGDAERTARYLKLARDDGYRDIRSAEKDPAFAPVIKDPRVQDVLRLHPAYAEASGKPAAN